MEDDEISLSASEDSNRGTAPPECPLTYSSIMEITTDIKSLFSAAITDIKTELLRLTEQLAVLERVGKRRDKALTRLDDIVSTHSQHLIEVN